MSGYYDWAPSVPLDRPVVLTGFLGARLGRVANVLSGLTGYRLVDLPRGVEHRAGKTLGALVVAHGISAVAEHEAALLKQALRVPPPPIVALGHRTLLDRSNRSLVSQGATLIYVRVSMDTAVRRVRRDIGENGANHYAWFEGTRPDHDDLRRMFMPLKPGYEAADHVVSGELTASKTAQAILDILQAD